jgi:hypothetical protein
MGRGGGAVNSVGEDALAGVVVLVPEDRLGERAAGLRMMP